MVILLGLMIKFGVAMEIIMLPGRIISGFINIIKTGSEWEQQLANINSLLGVQKDEIYQLGRALSDIERQYGTTGEVTQAAYEIASSLNQKLIDTAQSGYEGLGKETSAVAGFMELGAKTAVAGITEIETALEGLIRVQSGFNFSLAETEVAANAMFKAIDKGLFNFEQLSPHVGEIVGGLNAAFGSGDTAKSLNNFKEMLAVWSAVSIQLTPHETVTSLRNILANMQQLSAEAERFVNKASEYGVKLRPVDIVSMSPMQYMRELQRTLTPYGTLVDQAVKQNQGQVEEFGEEAFRLAQSRKFMQILFPNRRSMRGINAVLANDMQVLEAHYENMFKQQDALTQAMEANQDTVQNTMNRIGHTFSRIKHELFLSIRDPVKEVLDDLNDYLGTVVQRVDFKEASFIDKFLIIWEDMSQSFNKWMNSGGKQKLERVFAEIGRLFAGVLTLLMNPQVIQAFVDFGIAVGTGLVKGIITGIWQSVRGPLLGAIVGGLIGAPLGPFGIAVGAALGGATGDILTRDKSKTYQPPSLGGAGSQYYSQQYQSMQQQIASPIPQSEFISKHALQQHQREEIIKRSFAQQLGQVARPAGTGGLMVPETKMSDEEKAGFLGGYDPHAKSVYIGDIKVDATDKEEIIEALATLLDYADAPHTPVGQLNYLREP